MPLRRPPAPVRARRFLGALVLLALGACWWWHGQRAAPRAVAARIPAGRDAVAVVPVARHDADPGAPESFVFRLQQLCAAPPGAARTARLTDLLESWAAADPAAAAHGVLALADPGFSADA